MDATTKRNKESRRLIILSSACLTFALTAFGCDAANEEGPQAFDDTAREEMDDAEASSSRAVLPTSSTTGSCIDFGVDVIGSYELFQVADAFIVADVTGLYAGGYDTLYHEGRTGGTEEECLDAPSPPLSLTLDYLEVIRGPSSSATDTFDGPLILIAKLYREWSTQPEFTDHAVSWPLSETTDGIYEAIEPGMRIATWIVYDSTSGEAYPHGPLLQVNDADELVVPGGIHQSDCELNANELNGRTVSEAVAIMQSPPDDRLPEWARGGLDAEAQIEYSRTYRAYCTLPLVEDERSCGAITEEGMEGESNGCADGLVCNCETSECERPIACVRHEDGSNSCPSGMTCTDGGSARGLFCQNILDCGERE